MNNYTAIKLDNTEVKFKMPEEWKEVSFNDFLNFYDNRDNVSVMVHALTGLPLDFVENPDYTEFMLKVVDDLNKLGDLPNLDSKPKNLWTYEDKQVNIKLDSFKWTVSMSQQLDVSALKGGLTKDSTEKEIFELYPMICSIFMQPYFDGVKDYNYTESKKYEKYFKNLPFDDVVRLGGFFLSKLTKLSENTISQYLRQKTMRTRLQRVFKTLMKPLVSIKAYILYRRVARLSEGRY